MDAESLKLRTRVLEFCDVGTAYDGTSVSEGISFGVDRGEVVCVLGQSGCGKSSLIRIAAGLQKPSQGRVLFEGKDAEAPSRERAVVFQDDTLLPWRSVVRNVTLPLELRRMREGRRETAVAALRRVGLEVDGRKRPGQLSGGMRQRVQLARAIVASPKALLLDEPFSALDFISRTSMQDLVRQLADTLRLAVLIVSHDIGEAVRIADRTILLGGTPTRITAVYERNSDILSTYAGAENDALVGAFRGTLRARPALAGAPIGLTTGKGLDGSV